MRQCQPEPDEGDGAITNMMEQLSSVRNRLDGALWAIAQLQEIQAKLVDGELGLGAARSACAGCAEKRDAYCKAVVDATIARAEAETLQKSLTEATLNEERLLKKIKCIETHARTTQGNEFRLAQAVHAAEFWKKKWEEAQAALYKPHEPMPVDRSEPKTAPGPEDDRRLPEARATGKRVLEVLLDAMPAPRQEPRPQRKPGPRQETGDEQLTASQRPSAKGAAPPPDCASKRAAPQPARPQKRQRQLRDEQYGPACPPASPARPPSVLRYLPKCKGGPLSGYQVGQATRVVSNADFVRYYERRRLAAPRYP